MNARFLPRRGLDTTAQCLYAWVEFATETACQAGRNAVCQAPIPHYRIPDERNTSLIHHSTTPSLPDSLNSLIYRTVCPFSVRSFVVLLK